MKRANRLDNHGFTLLELLLVVAIIVTLLALALIPLTKYQKEFRQTELDSKAELVFTAVQNRMTQLQAAGMETLYAKDADGVSKLGLIPRWNSDERIDENTLYYVTSQDRDREGSAARAIFPPEQADAELWSGDWVVEFDPESSSVYAVFFGGDDMAQRYTPEGFNVLRSRTNRLDDGARVGYYSGDTVEVVETGKLEPYVEVINADHLQLRVTCAPAGVKDLKFKVQLWELDADGNTVGSGVSIELKQGVDGDTVGWVSPNYVATMTLDSLRDGMRFGQQSRFKDLTPGKNLKITVTVSSDDPLIDSASRTVKTNSLFADLENDNTAVVSYGRHVQNLDSASGLPDTITQAVQRQDIDFSADGDDEWQTLYPKTNRQDEVRFRPISNKNLTLFENENISTIPGQEMYSVIYDLPVAVSGGVGGLFGTVDDELELRNLRLCGVQAVSDTTATSSVGALAGDVQGKLNVIGCETYLSRSRGHLDDAEQEWLKGSIVGGLVGHVARGAEVTMEDSLAATVLSGTEAAGGLVGMSEGDLTVDHSYADCYVSAEDGGTASGLVGLVSTGSGFSVTNAYAAGFLTGDTTTGLAGADLSGKYKLENVYTACAPLEGDKLTYSTVRSGAATGTLYYLCDGEENAAGVQRSWSGSADRATAAAELGEAFTDETGGLNTVAYNLKVNGLVTYTYPKLTNLTHYGDWKAKFESGALAYYEVYTSGTGYVYGFFGGNKDELRDLPIVGDGYGAVYSGTSRPEDVTVTVGGTVVTLRGATAFRIVGKDGNTYWLMPLPTEVVNPTSAVENFYETASANGATYSFNPHFAKTVTGGKATLDKQVEQTISIRTPRQLYNLSKYYDGYREIVSDRALFQQERELDYATYLWTEYSLETATVKAQRPIGRTAESSFRYDYNGNSHVITNVTVTGNLDYMGLFGCNQGTLRNIVLAKDVAVGEEAPTIRISASLRTAYLGALAGRNEGVITNCAVSGYQLRVQAYRASTMYVGGLVGYNSGRIRSCGADFPLIYGATTYATVYIGGFAGGGTGQVRQSYAIGAANVEEIKGDDSVTLAGFMAENGGSIRDSYCAVSLVSASGAAVRGFSMEGGSVTGCYYLDGGTYSFRDKIASYDAQRVSGATAVTDEELMALSITGFGTADETYCHAATAGEDFPYPASVTAGGARVHYGDWPVKANLGTLGVFYWENEVGGANSGYHFSFIGFENGVEKRDESLCTVHNDGGVVTEYGYGYFWKDGETQPYVRTIEQKNISQRTDVNAIMERQVPGYRFASYVTGEDGLQILSASERDETWTLTHGTDTYTYQVSPFFGCAFNYMGGRGIAGTEDNIRPGEEDCPYQVRSVAQLQYINWSYYGGTGSTSRYVNSSTYQYFPYLQYATVTWTGTQGRRAAEQARPAQFWQQTHDLNGAGQAGTGNAADQSDAKDNQMFSPIAGAVAHSSSETGYDVVLYSWFGGSYDGESYYIKNINIDSPCYNVGLFGTTAGADIKNIVLYSDNSAYIRRSTARSNWDEQTANQSSVSSVEKYQCAYTLGGLAGIAYEYQGETGAVISNCAIAGYIIDDSSHNALKPGEATIGGLLGVSNVDLKQCSAVVDIQINCTHRWENDGGLNSAMWGNFIRVGGLVGGLRYKATDCYTGGKIVISKDTLIEQVKYYNKWGAYDTYNDRFTDGSEAVQVKWPSPRKNGSNSNANPGTYVFVGGIGASGFSSNFTNFSGKNGSTDGAPKFYNCYTYMDLPDMEGTIVGIALIGSVADRYRYTTCTIENCYYLDSTKSGISFEKLSKTWNPGKTSMETLMSRGTNREDMLNGNMNFLKDYLWEAAGSQTTPTRIYSRSYDQMSSESFKTELGKSYDWVTVEEQTETGSTELVHGKYSFPGDVDELLGQDYPFPTVLRQDKNGETVNLHYGSWPLHGVFWPEGITSMDLIADYDAAERLSYINLELTPHEVIVPATANVTFTYTEKDIVRAEVTGQSSSGGFNVRLIGLRPGATEVTAKVEFQSGAQMVSYTARLVVTVTAQIHITTDPTEEVSCYVGDSAKMKLSATDKNGDPLPNEKWTAVSSDPAIAVSTVSGQTATVRGVSEGDTALTVSVECTLPSGTYSANTVRGVNVRMQGILGISDSSGGTPIYWQGQLSREDADSGFSWAKEPETKTFDSGAPSCDGANVLLYSQGTDADLSHFTVQQVILQPESGTAVEIYPASAQDYRVTVDDAQTVGSYTVRPLHIYGRKAEQVTLTVTLRDARGGRDFVLRVPHTIGDPLLRSVTYLWGRGTRTYTETADVLTEHVTPRDYPGNATDNFIYWRRKTEDGETDETQYLPGIEYPLAGDVTFEAVYG